MANMIAKIPIGKFIKNNVFQPKYWVKHPPKVGPTAGADMLATPHKLIARGCFSFSIV